MVGRNTLIAALGLGMTVAALVASSPPATRGAGDGVYTHVDTWSVDSTWPSLIRPSAVAIDGEGTLYVADEARRRIAVYPLDGGPWFIDAPAEGYCGRRPDSIASCPLIPIALAVGEARRTVYVVWAAHMDVDGEVVQVSGMIEALSTDLGTRMSYPQASTIAFGAGVDPANGNFLFADLGGTVFHRDPNLGTVAAVTNMADTHGVNGRFAVLDGGRLAAPRTADGLVRFWDYESNVLGEVRIDQGEILDLAYYGGEVLVLVRPPDPLDPAAVAIVRVDPESLAVAGTHSLADLGLPAVPALDWPWDLAASSAGLAIVSGRTNFEVHQVDPGLAPRRQLEMARMEAWDPGRVPIVAGSTTALGNAPDGGLMMLAGSAGKLVSFTPDGEPSVVGSVPQDVIDFAPVDGGVVVSTAAGQLERWDLTGAVRPTWAVTCACGLGGRVTVVGDVAYVSRPRNREVAAFDLTTGAGVGQARLQAAVGLWPSDVTTSSGGRLLTGDLVTSQIQAWLSPQAPEVAWQAGLLAGPRRLSARRLNDESNVLGAIMADGYVELHETVGGNLTSRWQPVLSDGSLAAPADIALGPEGEVYLASSDGESIHVFRSGEGPTATPVVNPSATPTPSDKSCRVEGDKVAGPPVIVLGQTASVTLTLAADCPVRTTITGADIMLVIDRSGSMGGPNIDAAKAAATSFLELLDVRHHRIGIVSFSDSATLDVGLTTDSVAVADGVAALNAQGGTNITEGLRLADDHLLAEGRAEALPVIVLLSDGRHGGPIPPGPRAIAARNRGVQIYTVGLGSGADQDMLLEIAGSPERYFFAPSSEELFPIYTEILRIVVSSLAGNLIIDDEMSQYVTYLGGSARPPALEGGERLRWGRSLLPATGITLTYDILPLVPGLIPTNKIASADYTDGDGVRRSYGFPVPQILVITPTPTPTPEPRLIYLPSAYNSQCIPGRAHADVVMLIDTSSSMSGQKLEAAKAAALTFLENVDLDYDQAAVIGFDSRPRVATGLTHSRADLVRAVDSLFVSQGTRIDHALQAAESELLYGSGREPANRGVVVLMSDGAHNGSAQEVIDAASSLRPHTSAIYAIGLGADVDAPLLREVASPGGYYFAPSTDQLRDVYRAIAVRIPCR